MTARRRPRSRQGELFAIDENHRLVQLTHEIDWTELIELVQTRRAS